MNARAWLIGLTVLTLCGVAALSFGLPTVQHLPLWFWPMRITALSPVVVLGAGALAFAGVVASARRDLDLSVLVLVALLLQISLAFAEGRGEAGLRDHAIQSGHAEFVMVAASGVQPMSVATRYEELAATPGMQFIPSKPPGQLLLYIAADRVAEALLNLGLFSEDLQARDPIQGIQSERHRRLVEVLTIGLPLLAALAIIPIGWLSRELLPPSVGIWPAGLSAIAAPLALVTLHFDQAVYPGLAALLWWTAARGGGSPDRVMAWGVAAGFIGWIGLYISFSLGPAVALAPVVAWAASPPGMRPGRVAVFLGGVLVSLAIGWALTAAWTGYDPMVRYAAAMTHHAVWKNWAPIPERVALSALLCLVEFFYWAGPAALLFIAGAVAGLRRIIRRESEGLDAVAAALFLGILALSVAGKAVGETARLWIFLLPMVLLLAAHTLAGMDRARSSLHLTALAALQLLWTLALKLGQDFR